PPHSPLFPYTTLFRSILIWPLRRAAFADPLPHARRGQRQLARLHAERAQRSGERVRNHAAHGNDAALARAFRSKPAERRRPLLEDRKSTRLNSSHVAI